MDRGIYISMTGAKHNMRAQAIHANNLANINTPGFKKDFEQARAMPVFGEHHPSRAYAMTERPGTLTGSGALIETGNELDVAIDGEGWFVVETANGGEAYTRAGNFQLDINGALRSASGLPVLGNGGPIIIPEAEKIEIGADGTISIRAKGQAPDVLIEINQLRLVRPNPNEIEKKQDGLFHRSDDLIEAQNPEVRIITGFVETSNVSGVEAMVDVIELARQYEVQVKMIKSLDENTQASTKLLQIS